MNNEVKIALSDNTLMVGAGRVDITPPLTIPYLGFPPGRHSYFEGVHDPLYAKAVVMDDGARRIALVVADSIGLAKSIMGEGRDFIGEVRRRVEHLCGIRSDHVMVSATHAHSTPETIGFRRMLDHPGAESWLETLADQLASAVAIADHNRVPVRLKQATGLVEGIGQSRRILGKDGKIYNWVNRPPDEEVAEWGVNAPEVTVLCFETMDRTPETVLVNFAVHPVTVQAQPLVSADFPGEVASHIQEADLGCRHCLYLQGAAGSIDPEGGVTGDFSDVARYGKILAEEVINLLSAIRSPDYPAAPSRVDAAMETVTVRSRPIPDIETLLQLRRCLEEAVISARTQEKSQQARWDMLSLDEQMERVKKGDANIEAEMQVLRVGQTALVGIPGEAFAEMGVEINGWSDAPCSLCVGYANDYLGYICPPSAWKQGGYEVSLGMWSIVGPEAYEMLLQTGRTLVKRLFRE